MEWTMTTPDIWEPGPMQPGHGRIRIQKSATGEDKWSVQKKVGDQWVTESRIPPAPRQEAIDNANVALPHLLDG